MPMADSMPRTSRRSRSTCRPPATTTRADRCAVTRLLDAHRRRAGVRARHLALERADEPGRHRSRATTIEGYAPRTGRGHDLPLQRRRARLFPDAAHPAARRPRIRADRRCRRARRGDRQRNAGPPVLADAGERRSASACAAARSEWRSVIGVARDLKYSRLSEAPRPFVYYPLLQTYAPALTIHARADRRSAATRCGAFAITCRRSIRRSRSRDRRR